MYAQHSHATIADVAARAGVSTATVSRVLNRTAAVSAGTAARVQQAVTELGFVPQAAARNLARRKSSTLGLLLPAVGTDFFYPILRGIEAAARQAGFDLLIGIQPAQRRRLEPAPLGDHNTDGLLVFAGELTESELKTLGERARPGFPIVLLYRTPPQDSGFSAVVLENRNGAYQAVEHLVTVHGRQKIAFLRGPLGNQDSEQRMEGFRQALATHGLSFDPQLVVAGNYSVAVAAQSVSGLLKDGATFDAIFAADDDSASGALTALKAAAIHVPEQVALAGFDDSFMASYLDPPLTTVRAPTEQLGREAVRLLIRSIHDRASEPQITLLPTHLVIRRSCGCENGR
jgi:LacI family transcriptional regulator